MAGNGDLNFNNGKFATANNELTGTVNMASDTSINIGVGSQTAPLDFRGVTSGVGSLPLINLNTSSGTTGFKFNQTETNDTPSNNTYLTTTNITNPIKARTCRGRRTSHQLLTEKLGVFSVMARIVSTTVAPCKFECLLFTPAIAVASKGTAPHSIGRTAPRMSGKYGIIRL